MTNRARLPRMNSFWFTEPFVLATSATDVGGQAIENLGTAVRAQIGVTDSVPFTVARSYLTY